MTNLHFPTDADVIAEEAARFRALAPAERMRVICGILEAGELMMRNSPKAEFLRWCKEQQEEDARRAIREFIARHAQPE